MKFSLFVTLVNLVPLLMAVLIAWVMFHQHAKYQALQVKVLQAAVGFIGLLILIARLEYWTPGALLK